MRVAPVELQEHGLRGEPAPPSVSNRSHEDAPGGWLGEEVERRLVVHRHEEAAGRRDAVQAEALARKNAYPAAHCGTTPTVPSIATTK
jgi:hypothetical protein